MKTEQFNSMLWVVGNLSLQIIALLLYVIKVIDAASWLLVWIALQATYWYMIKELD